jgi:hypothetical protein
MASVATASVVWTGFESVAGAVGGDGSTPVSFSITVSTTTMGLSVPTSNSGFSTMTVEPWTTVGIAPLAGGFCTLGSCSYSIELLVS